MSKAPKVKKPNKAGRKPLKDRGAVKIRVDFYTESHRVDAVGGLEAARELGITAIEKATEQSQQKS